MIHEEKGQPVPPTQEEIVAALKAKYGTIFTVKVPVDDEGKEFAYAYCKKVDRMIMLTILGKARNNHVEALDMLFKNSVIPEASDPRIYGPNSDDDMYLGAVMQMEGIVTIKVAELKKN